MDKKIGTLLSPITDKAATILKGSKKTIATIFAITILFAIINAINPYFGAVMAVIVGTVIAVAFQIGIVVLIIYLIMRSRRAKADANERRTDQRFR